MRLSLVSLAAAAALTLGGGSACIPDVVPDVFTLPQCDGVDPTCGPSGKESCCASKVVPAGDFWRANKMEFPAHVSAFKLDRFEVTVGRFRRFVGSYPVNRPAKGAGQHPRIPGSGWDAAWETFLPKDRAALESSLACDPTFATWTDEAGAHEELPINCVSWYLAFAFCAWDGGRLPTEAEWNYAAAGAAKQRDYPWGSGIAQTVGVQFNCETTLGMCLLRVGATSPASDGLYGQADLGGNLAEWTLDFHGDFLVPCDDCALLKDAGNGREVRGGDFAHGTDGFYTYTRIGFAPELPVDTMGIRCARGL